MIYINKNWSIILLCISILALGSALIAEHFFNLAPCDMCLKQRHPYYLILICLILIFLFKNLNKICFNLNKISKMALEDPSTATNPKKMTIDDMKILYEHSISGELF